MKKLCCLFMVIGLLMVAMALPALAAGEGQAPDAAVEETTSETMEEIEIEDEETPLAGLPGMDRADIARIIIGAGCFMMIVAGTILITGYRRAHARR